MDEHDDDLESTVHEGADEETDEFPNTGDELGTREDADDWDSDDDVPLDDDDSEL